MKELLANSQPILVALQEKIRTLTQQLQAAAGSGQARGWRHEQRRDRPS